ncbi:TPA: hypothetical protein IQJ52_002846 [Listeria monocytogenes]|nr:hypothetical protein [Listeria monocytogenes]HAO5784525.1 hypothetical protein [Listeria monocytogenes]HAO5844526.1 hypothetical protein [Listeria monocytogenes]HAO5977588.1 hypothetical protein [Listeria monocytogenes]HAO6219952.1 hypothetical protein [Listeria monocytogenes]
MMSRKGKFYFVLVTFVLVVVGVVGWQVLQLYTQPETEDKANLASQKGEISKENKAEPDGNNNAETEQITEEQVDAAVQAEATKERNEKEDLEQTVEAFTKAFLTYSSDTASVDFEKATHYMTKEAKSANLPNTDEKYETNQGIYKQTAGDTDVYLDVPLNGKEAFFITITACHSESDGGISSDFPLMLRGELEKQEDNSWLISQVTIGNPANFPEEFFQ